MKSGSIDNLTPEQQQVVAEIELARFRARERLHQKARHYRGKRWLSFVCFGLAAYTLVVNIELPYKVVAVAVLALIFAVMDVHVTGINQRLDTVLELLSDAERNTSKTKQSPQAD